MEQLEWIRLHVDKLLSSPAWQAMKDFQRGWYIQLLLLMCRNKEGPGLGYLRHDGNLWRKAGAHTRGYFEGLESDQQPRNRTVLACFRSRQYDGHVWIYSPRLLEEITGQTQKLQTKREKHISRGTRLSLTSCDVLSKKFEVGYRNYPRHVGKRAAEKAYFAACARVVEKQLASKLEEAADYINSRAEMYAQTPAGQRGIYTPHMSTWLNQDRFLDDPAEWNTVTNGGERESSFGRALRELES